MDLENMTIAQLNDLIREKGLKIDAEKDSLRKLCRARDEKAELLEIAKHAPHLAKKLGLPTPTEEPGGTPSQVIRGG